MQVLRNCNQEMFQFGLLRLWTLDHCKISLGHGSRREPRRAGGSDLPAGRRGRSARGQGRLIDHGPACAWRRPAVFPSDSCPGSPYAPPSLREREGKVIPRCVMQSWAYSDHSLPRHRGAMRSLFSSGAVLASVRHQPLDGGEGKEVSPLADRRHAQGRVPSRPACVVSIFVACQTTVYGLTRQRYQLVVHVTSTPALSQVARSFSLHPRAVSQNAD